MAQNQRIVQQRRKRIDMKRYIILFTGFLMIGCGRKPIDNIIDNSENHTDLYKHIMPLLTPPMRSALKTLNINNLKDTINIDQRTIPLTPITQLSLNTLLDDLYKLVQNEDLYIRAEAQRSALYLVPTIIDNYFHNIKTDTALLSKMVNKINLITGEWYIVKQNNKKVLIKEILHDDDMFQLYFFIDEQSNKCDRFVISFPENAQLYPSISFCKEEFLLDNEDISTISLDKVLPADSIIVYDGIMMTFCDPKTIDYFLNNAVVYIGYINNNEDEEMKNRFEIGRLLLARFQEQYNEIIQR